MTPHQCHTPTGCLANYVTVHLTLKVINLLPHFVTACGSCHCVNGYCFTLSLPFCSRGCPPTPTALWDDPGAGHSPHTLVRTLLPKPTRTARYGLSTGRLGGLPHALCVAASPPFTLCRCTNIPGYHGHTHWAQVNPAHSTLNAANLPTTPRVHR